MSATTPTTSILSAEFYKLRTQRTPLVCALLLLAGVLASPVVLIFYTPGDPSVYGTAFEAAYAILAILLSIVFGGWLLGNEYRQGTTKRLLATEPRRLRALGAKAVVGVSGLVAGLGATALVGWSASWLVGSMNDVSVAWDWRPLMAAGLFAIGAATVAFGLSAITRSDSFAMVGALGLVVVLDPLLSLIPKVGKYGFGTALDSLTSTVAGTTSDFGEVALSTGTATVTVLAWLTLFVGGGSYLFATRDV